MPTTNVPDTLVRVGVLTRPFGLAGGVRCELDLDAVPFIETPVDAWLGFSESFLQTIELRKIDRRPDDLVVYVNNIDDRNAAEALIDKGLWLEANVVQYDQATIHPRLFGYDVVDEEGRVLGTITSIVRTAAHPLWGITRDGFERLVPAVEPFVVSIDHENRRAVVRTIPGLLDDDFEVIRGDDSA